MRAASSTPAVIVFAALALATMAAGVMLLFPGSPLRRNLLHIRILKGVHNLTPLHPRELTGTERRPARHDLVRFVDMAAAAGPCRLSASVSLTAGLPDRAAEALRGCSEDSLGALFLAYAHAMRGRQEEARDALGRVPGIASYLLSGGMEEHRRGNPRAAAWLLAEALERDPSSEQIVGANRALAYQYLVEDLDRLGLRDPAIEWARRWVQSDPLNFRASTVLAGQYLRLGSVDEAFRVLESIERLGGRQDFLFPGQLGQVYAARGDWDRAVEEYRAWWERAKDVEWARPYAAWYLGSALHHQGRREEARAFLEIVQRTGNAALRERAAALLAQH